MFRHGWRVLCALLLVGTARAEVLGVRGTTNAVEFYGAETNTLLVNPTPVPCCGIAVGASARDATNNRHWLATTSASTGTRLHAIDAVGNTASIDFNSNDRIEALAFDSPRNEVLALARRGDNDVLRVYRYNASSGALAGTSDVGSTCCVLRSGVSAWSAQLRAFVVVGRTLSSPELALIAIRHDGLFSAYLSVLAASTSALAVHPATQVLYGLQTPDVLAATTRLHQISLDAGGVATYGAIGAGEADCCLILAGPATIAGGKLQVHARPLSATTAALHQFDLSTGNVAVLPTPAIAAALHDDTAVPVSITLFRDGFE